jgi:hypothetical protein
MSESETAANAEPSNPPSPPSLCVNGHPVQPDENFCPVCGVRLKETPALSDAGEPLFTLRITTVTSYLVIAQQRLMSFSVTAADLRARYRQVLRHNLLCGWWSFPFGPIWTPMVLQRNARALKQLEALVARNVASDAPGHAD